MKKVILCILDGYGIRRQKEGNAVLEAKTPVFDELSKKYPYSKLVACGEKVGLPKGQMGNSEVGHMNIGAGRIVDQPLQMINKEIQNNNLNKNKELRKAISHAKENNSKLHLMGLLSDGGVHSHIEHLYAIINMIKEENFNNLYLHVFLDGRDTAFNAGEKFIAKLEKKLKKAKIGKIASVSGRFYAMDRDKRWERTKKAYDTIVEGKNFSKTPIREDVLKSYSLGISDEFFEPKSYETEGKIETNDAIIWSNFRPDRATEILESISNPRFRDFETKQLKNIKLVTMMPCSSSVIGEAAFPLAEHKNTLGEYLSRKNLSQLRIAETEKYAHVTYFFDGGKDEILPRVKRILVPSDKEVLTYDMKPEMSAYEIIDNLEIETPKKYDLIVINFANCDMVGHTGNYEATLKAVETVDECLGKVYKMSLENDYTLFITADHGNADYMLDKGKVITSHSMAKVPFVICDEQIKIKNGKLGDIAPTILKFMDLEIPEEMEGNVLIGK